MKEKILNIVNTFLKRKCKTTVQVKDKLYESGLLDSLDFFELIFFLEKNGIFLNKEEITKDTFKMNLSLIDSVEEMSKYVKI